MKALLSALLFISSLAHAGLTTMPVTELTVKVNADCTVSGWIEDPRVSCLPSTPQ